MRRGHKETSHRKKKKAFSIKKDVLTLFIRKVDSIFNLSDWQKSKSSTTLWGNGHSHALVVGGKMAQLL